MVFVTTVATFKRTLKEARYSTRKFCVSNFSTKRRSLPPVRRSDGSISFRGNQTNLPKTGSNFDSQSVSCSKRRASLPDGRMTEISKHVKKQK